LYLLNGCSSENSVTSPVEKNNYKTPVFKAAPSNGRFTDTTIVLPASKMVIKISKEITADKIALVDSFFNSHTIKAKPFIITPNASACNIMYVYFWLYPGSYKTVQGKYLGIWTDKLSPYLCNQYGFNQYFVGYNPNLSQLNVVIDSVHNAGYDYSNLMVGLGNDSLSYNQNIISGTNKNIGYYFIDEPIEQNAFGNPALIGQSLAPLMKNKNPDSKLFLTDYRWPTASICGGSTGTNLMNIIKSSDNVYIQCDQYDGNCCGNAADYWDVYMNFYGINTNVSNWISVFQNDGNHYEYFPCTSTKSSDWSTLFNRANSYGMNNIWLYALGMTDLINFNKFLTAAWANGWLLQKQMRIVAVFKCNNPDPCANCRQSGGNWYISDLYSDLEVWNPY
jgi:hypothetical protein